MFSHKFHIKPSGATSYTEQPHSGDQWISLVLFEHIPRLSYIAEPAGVRWNHSQQLRRHTVCGKGLRRPGWSTGRMAETQFKKGRPAIEARNYVPIGTEKVDPERKVLMRKITDDPKLFPVNRWRPVHVLV